MQRQGPLIENTPALSDLDLLVRIAIRRVAEREGVPLDAVVLPVQGEANHTVLLGERLVVRIPRDGGVLSDDLRKEAEVIPVVIAAGVRTPAVVAFEAGGTEDGRPLMVMERAISEPWAPESPDSATDHDISRSLGIELRRLHDAGVVGDHRLPSVPTDLDTYDPRESLPDLARNGRLDRSAAGGLWAWLDRLAAHRPRRTPLVLIHGDVAPGNILVGPDSGPPATLIDWGDAAFADPAMDLAKLPISTLPAVIDGYLDDPGADERLTWLARALWYHVAWGVAALARDELDAARATNRLAVVLRHFESAAHPAWDEVRPPSSFRG